MYQKQILFEKLKEATASVLPISLIVMAISFVLVPVDAGLMLSFILATAMLILGMGLFTLGADMSMSRIGNYMGSKMTKSRKLGLVLVISFALGVAITVAEPDLQVLAGNVPEIDTTVLILTVSVGVGFFLMLCMVRILFSISLRTMLIVFYAIVFAAAFLSDESILSVAFDSGGVTTGPMTVPFIMALGVGVASIRSDENAKADSFGLVGLCSIGPILSVLLLGAIYKTQPAQGESSVVSGVSTTVELGQDYLHALPEYLWEVTMALLPIFIFFLIFQVVSLKLRKLPFLRILIGILYTYFGLVLFLTGVNVGFSPLGYALGAALASNSRVASVTVSEALQDIVDNTMKSLDYIVGLVVVCACALALVVLFNLCNISITERVREIATVKVLGFYHRETLNYVFREILLLTFCGALVGLPAGWALHRFIMQNIRISLVSFHIHVTPLSYALAFAATLLLAVAVCLCLIRKIDRISMAESLKSIE